MLEEVRRLLIEKNQKISECLFELIRTQREYLYLNRYTKSWMVSTLTKEDTELTCDEFINLLNQE